MQPRNIVIHSYRDGRILSKMDLDPTMQQTYDAPYLVIPRAELLNAMAEKAKDIGVTIVLGSVIESIDFSKPSILMEDKSVLAADFMIGADGERSFYRDALFGHPDPPHHSGDIVYRTVIPIEKLRGDSELICLVEPPAVHFWLGPDAHTLSYSLKEDGLLDVVLIRRGYPDAQATSSPEQVEMDHLRDSAEQWDRTFKKQLGYAQQASQWILVECTDLPSWIHPARKFTLLGDSAHAMLP